MGYKVTTGNMSSEKFLTFEDLELVDALNVCFDEQYLSSEEVAELKEQARGVPQAILARSACSVGELLTMKNELVSLRDRLNAVLGEGAGRP